MGHAVLEDRHDVVDRVQHLVAAVGRVRAVAEGRRRALLALRDRLARRELVLLGRLGWKRPTTPEYRTKSFVLLLKRFSKATGWSVTPSTIWAPW